MINTETATANTAPFLMISVESPEASGVDRDGQALDVERCYCCRAPRQAGSPICDRPECEDEWHGASTAAPAEQLPELAGEDFEFDGSVWEVSGR